jgi:hypothetical protein
LRTKHECDEGQACVVKSRIGDAEEEFASREPRFAQEN